MRKAMIIKIVVGALLLPLSSLFLVSKFNLFSYLEFIPIEYQYEAGLACYIAIIDAVYEYIAYQISKRQTKVTFVFYKAKNEMMMSNVPTVMLSEQNNGVATFNCRILLEGNLKRLQKTKIQLPLPAWVTSQIPQNDEMMCCDEAGVYWEFSKILPSNSDYKQRIECTSKIPLIKNQSENALSITVKPQMEKKHRWNSWGIEFETNEIIIQNRE